MSTFILPSVMIPVQVNELSSALVMVVEKLNRRLSALEEGRVSLSAQASDLGRPLSPRVSVPPRS
jgi:hypothetical protein